MMYGIIDCDNCYCSCEKVFRPDFNFCPGWKGYFTSQSEEKKAELRAKYNFTKY